VSLKLQPDSPLWAYFLSSGLACRGPQLLTS
jgi:hypothetical protein